MAKRKKILIVTAEQPNLNILVDLLKPDYEVEVERNAEKVSEAISIADPPDLILLDITIPEKIGREVCRRLKAEDIFRAIPVILITDKKKIGEESKCLEMGAVDYITKPVFPPIVMARVKTHLALK